MTASLNVDFTNPNTILTFTPFSVSQTQSFTVQILPDLLIENDETFEVELSIPSQSASLAQLGTPSETAVTIVDDDRKLLYLFFRCLDETCMHRCDKKCAYNKQMNMFKIENE